MCVLNSKQMFLSSFQQHRNTFVVKKTRFDMQNLYNGWTDRYVLY